jgi:UDP-N-acetylmuramate-alanine ligase
VIYSEAAVQSREVLQARSIARENKKQMIIWNYFEFLGEISKYFSTVGFAGTNGKSSSAALGIYIAAKTLPDFGL